MDRASISVCIVTFNEEDRILECLESVRWADEIIVVDSFSTDRTVEYARRFTDRIIQRPWPGHVAQKNFALDQAQCDWVLCVDADERVSPELAAEIQDVLRAPDRHEVGYTMPRKTFYLGRWIRHGGWYPDRKLRLVRRGTARWGGTDPHDRLHVRGPVEALKGDLLHYTYRDISDHLRTIDRFTSIAAREIHEAGGRHPLIRMLLHPPARFLRMYLLQFGFLDGVPGLLVAVLGSYYVFLKYAKVWELQHARSENGR